MRLICPKCAARYEVPEKNVPSNGREVQCSACGHTWFQTHPGLGNIQAPMKALDQETKVAAHDIKPVRDGSGFEEGCQPSETRGTPLRRLHPTVAEVLKEEARREVAVREAEKIENQPKLGVDETVVVETPSFDGDKICDEEIIPISADKYGEELEALRARVPQTETNSKSDRVTDIEEINAPMNSSERKNHKTTDNPDYGHIRDRKRIKRLGLLTGVLTVVCFFLIYHFSEDIAQAIPQSVLLLDVYVQFVDRLRVTSDQWIARVIVWLENQADIVLGSNL